MSKTSRAEKLLACTLTYRDAQVRSVPLETTFETVDAAIDAMKRVLLHEAHEAMQSPLQTVPEQLYLHPVDVDTDEPGIVDKTVEEGEIVRRYKPDSVPRMSYAGRHRPAPSSPPPCAPLAHASLEEASAIAERHLAESLAKAEKKALTVERREAKQRDAKEARARETPSERTARLDEARSKREERARLKAERAGGNAPAAESSSAAPPKKPVPAPASAALLEECMLVSDASAPFLNVPSPLRKRRRNDKTNYFEHPVPHHRHLQGLQTADPAATLLPALLRGETSEDVEIFQGPPGTGKTCALIDRLQECDGLRVYLCAPTNVGACNLYTRCVSQGHQCALVIPPERIPVGTIVLSNDPSERIVCGTVSSRSGAMLDAQAFDAVFVDEAAQCMESWVWTLLRPEVKRLVLAGDVHQLPALVSRTGEALRHERSLMERLVVDLKYDNVVHLTEQNRMAPEILQFPNWAFYGNSLTMGPHAPKHGVVTVIEADAGAEDAVGTSFCNRAEAECIARLLREEQHSEEEPDGNGAGTSSTVLITPYAAQCRALLSMKTGCEVHTIDSFQGREADVVYLSVVRDGSNGLGFWMDDRRLTVALTRARKRLVVVVTKPHCWPSDATLSKFVKSC